MKKDLMLFIISLAALTSCKSPNHKKHSDQTIPVRLTRVEKRLLSRPIRTSGLLSSSAEMKLSFKIGGIIEKLDVDEGDYVEKGQILAALKLDEIQSQVKLARKGFEKTERHYQRAKNLYADSVATLEQLQDAETGMEVARSHLNIAEFNLEHSKIIAPENGRILKRLAEKNELIAPGYPVFIFGTVGHDWIVRVGVTDQDVVHLTLGDSASVSFDAYEGVSFPAKVREIAGAPDPMNGIFEIELLLRQNQYKLINGFIARVEIFPEKKKPVCLIPFDALVEADGKQSFVFLPSDDGKAIKQPITIAYLTNHKVAVSQGLENVNHLISDGASYLKEGAYIHVVDSTEQSNAEE
jgi:multidrug efflux system membrane fusion protein